MKKIALFILFLCAIYSCKKKKDDFYGEGRFSGLLVYYSPYAGDIIPRPLAGRKVFLSYHPSDTLNYIYSATTNSDGYFVFTNVRKDTLYDLFFADTIGGQPFKAVLSGVAADKDTLLIATPDNEKQNGLSVVATDPAGTKLEKVKILAYTGRDVYLADSTAGTNTSAVLSFETNKYGYDVKYGIAAIKYYLVAQKQTGSLLYKGYSEAEVSTIGIKQASIVLATTLPVNTLKISVTDTNSKIIAGASVFVYNNFYLYSSDSSTGGTTGAIKTLTTNAYGVDSMTNIPAGRYYFIGKQQVGSLAFWGYGQSDLPAIGRVDFPLSIGLISPLNGIKVTINDSLNNPVYNSTVYVYSSPVVADADTLVTGPVAYTYSMTTSFAGVATTTNIPAASYYLRARKTIGATMLKGKTDNVLVPSNQVKNVSVTIH